MKQLEMRSSGRTTRMMISACMQAANGEHVLVIVESQAEIDRLRSGVKEVRGPGTLTLVTTDDVEVPAMYFAGKRFTVILEDHFSEERRVANWEEKWHRKLDRLMAK